MPSNFSKFLFTFGVFFVLIPKYNKILFKFNAYNQQTTPIPTIITTQTTHHQNYIIIIDNKNNNNIRAVTDKLINDEN